MFRKSQSARGLAPKVMYILFNNYCSQETTSLHVVKQTTTHMSSCRPIQILCGLIKVSLPPHGHLWQVLLVELSKVIIWLIYWKDENVR